ncbi:MAG: NupC/NupG family nucleoside CNT transporter, partial [Acidobacteria bacterium]|nr:NupC/NupG family nucleoside CNT transporter [Acidobacteriota bacterium]
PDAPLDLRTTIIAAYALCGFANFPSIAIQIGGISALAPDRRSDLASLALRAMFAGAFASWCTACVAGLFVPLTP